MSHQLPNLSYSVDALEPHIDARTMEIHHGKHHQTYINNLNAALESNSDLSSKSVDDLISDLSQVPEDIRGAVRNNGGGHSNHTFFWQVLSPSGGEFPLVPSTMPLTLLLDLLMHSKMLLLKLP